ncbi:MAG TPA: outer membrane beta-barrel protein [Cellvibrio sp.]|nr:outer membrane beta-barrel protein [Cellvibrio sp.]
MKIALTLAILLFSLNAQALEKSHELGVVLGSGSMHNDYEFEDNSYVIYSGLFYQYRFSPQYALVATYLGGNDDWCLITCMQSKNRRIFNYDMEQLGVKRSFQASYRWSLFAELALNYYQTKITGNGIYDSPQLPDRKDSGINAAAAAGIEFTAQNGFNVGFKFQYAPMKYMDMQTYNAFVGFAF